MGFNKPSVLAYAQRIYHTHSSENILIPDLLDLCDIEENQTYFYNSLNHLFISSRNASIARFPLGLGALAGGTFWDLSNGAGYSRFVVIVVIVYFSLLRALPLFLGGAKPVKQDDDK